MERDRKKASAVIIRFVLAALVVLCASTILFGEEDEDAPPLPKGLANKKQTKPDDDEPALPGGLKTEDEDAPPLPGGLGKKTAAKTKAAAKAGFPFDLSGFIEMRVGARMQRDSHERDISIGELRLQLELEKEIGPGTFKLRLDFLIDPVYDHHTIRLDDGFGWLDVREANYSFSPADFIDVKIGRQVLTWGTGDLVFINDLFPKDWNSFFLGRDLEYLKAPSDAIKVTLYSDLANVDLVYSPNFDSDRFIDGSRISFYNTNLGRRSGRDAVVNTDTRNHWFNEDEIALRLFRTVGGSELAAYAYMGYWKSPGGFDPMTGRATFPRLNVYGASARGPVGKGIGNAEIGYYDSADDRNGSDPFVRNDELRFLLGYEWELARDFTAAVQYYLEHMLNHGAYMSALPPGVPDADKSRHVLTLRLTRRLMDQNLTLSWFMFYSPNDHDVYACPNVKYKIDDHWTAEAGANVLLGKYQHTFFNQFSRNSNVYFALRYGF